MQHFGIGAQYECIETGVGDIPEKVRGKGNRKWERLEYPPGMCEYVIPE